MSQPTTNTITTRSTEPGDVESAVVEWLRVELDDAEITGSENFLDIGGHSLTFAKLNTFLGDSFGFVLDSRTTYEESISKAVADRRPATDATGD